ncbi:helix-turn-helix domain-containing protein [Mucilaginibacter mali]|uniref:Helix-turn-helix domain-containing protein n=1 Tax=Mucilaginibacter mali TaxID=2740462 RepID=A0A7D4UFE3_9SPHI|nr:helix-turn-helix domain-containing protein [Mucilaginibacter mali]QKJ30296.1 helix-turn-helix domain-containing protein [Mucilaginibacter mali]
MSAEVITKEDLQIFRIQLLDDIKRMLSSSQPKEENSEWIKSKEARRILKASPGTLQNLRISGQLNPVKISGSWRYKLDEVNALFHKGK